MKETKPGKKVPQRTCVSCRSVHSKRELVRIVRTEIGIEVDQTGRKNGRGAYLCRDVECWDKATRTDGLGRALKSELTPDETAQLEHYAKSL